jgi:hypothetical protein
MGNQFVNARRRPGFFVDFQSCHHPMMSFDNVVGALSVSESPNSLLEITVRKSALQHRRLDLFDRCRVLES